jgi:hypothetical protein
MQPETKAQIERKIFQGELGDFLAELNELIWSTPPLSSEAHVDEFESSVVYKDFLKEMQAWLLKIESEIIQGTDASVDYLRGCHAGIKTAMGFTHYLRKQIEDAKEEEKEDASE